MALPLYNENDFNYEASIIKRSILSSLRSMEHGVNFDREYPASKFFMEALLIRLNDYAMVRTSVSSRKFVNIDSFGYAKSHYVEYNWIDLYFGNAFPLTLIFGSGWDISTRATLNESVYGRPWSAIVPEACLRLSLCLDERILVIRALVSVQVSFNSPLEYQMRTALPIDRTCHGEVMLYNGVMYVVCYSEIRKIPTFLKSKTVTATQMSTFYYTFLAAHPVPKSIEDVLVSKRDGTCFTEADFLANRCHPLKGLTCQPRVLVGLKEGAERASNHLRGNLLNTAWGSTAESLRVVVCDSLNWPVYTCPSLLRLIGDFKLEVPPDANRFSKGKLINYIAESIVAKVY